MKFYTGARQIEWIGFAEFPLMYSRSFLRNIKRLPIACTDWVLDSGAFTEISTYGHWRIDAKQYAKEVKEYRMMGRMDWAAQQDWMCEPFILKKTGLTVATHQLLTVKNFVELRSLGLDCVIPVLQGYTLDDYKRCHDLFSKYVDLSKEKTVGLGSVCRRQRSNEIIEIVSHFKWLNLHGFGVKQLGLEKIHFYLKSADSHAWALQAFREPPLPGCTHLHCGTCYKYAKKWTLKIQEIFK
jgi:hypothetical protein